MNSLYCLNISKNDQSYHRGGKTKQNNSAKIGGFLYLTSERKHIFKIVFLYIHVGYGVLISSYLLRGIMSEN